jgi:hypothetical protein
MLSNRGRWRCRVKAYASAAKTRAKRKETKTVAQKPEPSKESQAWRGRGLHSRNDESRKHNGADLTRTICSRDGCAKRVTRLALREQTPGPFCSRECAMLVHRICSDD